MAPGHLGLGSLVSRLWGSSPGLAAPCLCRSSLPTDKQPRGWPSGQKPFRGSGLCSLEEDGAIFRKLWPEAPQGSVQMLREVGQAGSTPEIWQDAGPGNGPGASTRS